MQIILKIIYLHYRIFRQFVSEIVPDYACRIEWLLAL